MTWIQWKVEEAPEDGADIRPATVDEDGNDDIQVQLGAPDCRYQLEEVEKMGLEFAGFIESLNNWLQDHADLPDDKVFTPISLSSLVSLYFESESYFDNHCFRYGHSK